EASRLDRVEQIEAGTVREAIVREHHVHVADRDALDRLGDGPDDGQLDMGCVTHEMTVGQLLIGGIAVDIQHTDRVHGLFQPSRPAREWGTVVRAAGRRGAGAPPAEARLSIVVADVSRVISRHTTSRSSGLVTHAYAPAPRSTGT